MYKVTVIENVLGIITATTYTFTSIPQREKFIRICEQDDGVLMIEHENKKLELQEV